MNDFRFLNTSQPQTLMNGTLLCYIDAAFGVLYGWVFSGIGLLLVIGLAAGGIGIANEKKWGYGVAVAAACAQLGLFLLFFGFNVLEFPLILTLLFDVVLVVLLLHPQSREYQRIWFK